MKNLTQAEEQVMQVLWKIKKGFVNDILEHFPEPKPAYTTISTIIRILEKKGFTSHKSYGKSHEYYPLVSRTEYSSGFLRRFVRNYFNDSFPALGSFLAKENDVDVNDLEEIKKVIEEEIRKQKNQNND
ncbi:MAG: BlaI/MecI/CopY family transcriptional regulator [Bacteroidales bacterium]|nr:BlaI/MecI/CopY family transcriptional regulator [Bacteroidales bacterium]